jgi:hypothetical protein
MGIEIKLTDRELQISPYFVDFLDRFLNNKGWVSDWHDQLGEAMSKKPGEENERAKVVLQDLANNPLAHNAINRSYEFLMSILLGAADRLTPIHNRFRFIAVVGAPRSGGSYLTKHLFRAIGKNPKEVPRVIAHDGFPDLSPFVLLNGFNQHTMMTQRLAEYLTMVELYFAKSRIMGGHIIVPKKAFNAAYQGAFFNRILGPATEYIVTLRHPVTSCISTYEKSNGMLPKDGRFAVRGGIETLMQRDNMFTSGESEESVQARDYFDVYLRYWEQYHHNLALTGLSANKNWTIVPYTEEAMTKEAQGIYSRLEFKKTVEPFKVFDKRTRHPNWFKKSEESILRVRDVWSSVGLIFPTDEVMQAW